MKYTFFLTVILGALLVFEMSSCVSLQDRTLTANEREQIRVLGTVETKWVSWQWFHVPAITKKALTARAYKTLLEIARTRYTGEIDVRNITLKGSFAAWELPMLIPPIILAGILAGDFQTIKATGEVVLISENARRSSGGTSPVEQAANRAFDLLSEQLPEGSTIAVLSISAGDTNQGALVIDELEYLLVMSRKYRVVDRQTLDVIRREQNFQMQGEVNDETAVSIGKLAGANVVFTGTITGSGSSQRLMLKALNVQTGEIVAMAREQF